MDAIHFRERAASAREMAQSGDDLRLSRMLLEVALDLDAEAEAIEADGLADRRKSQRLRGSEIYGAFLHLVGSDTDAVRVQIIDLSTGGARLRVDRSLTVDSRVVLELHRHRLRLEGTILRLRGTEAAMAFDPGSAADPALSRLLQSEAGTEQVWA